MGLAWVQLDTRGKKVLACSCEEQVALQSSPMGALSPLLPQSISPAWSPWLLSLDFSPLPASSLAAVQPAWCQPCLCLGTL